MNDETHPADEDESREPPPAEMQDPEPKASDEAPVDEESPVTDEEEIELEDGLTLRLPPAQARKLRDGWLRQADYTRKTQELAERRKSFEADRQTVWSSTNEELEAFATLRTLEGQVEQLQQTNWAALQDPMQALKAHMHYQQVRDAASEARARYDSARKERLSSEQQNRARLVEEGRTILTRDIGWNDELKARLTDHALQRGLSRDDLADLEANPVAAMILKDAYEWAQHQTKTQAANRLTQAQQAKPAATVSARRAPPTGLDDRLSTDEWVRRRNDQVRKRG